MTDVARRATSENRVIGFDLLRVLGILAVIYIHGCDTSDVARKGMKWLVFAVPCFFMMSAFLGQRAVLSKDLSVAAWIKKRWVRLAPPYFFWSFVYLAVRFGKSVATQVPVDASIAGCIFWGDASYQLYFVPLLFYSFVCWTGPMMLAKRHWGMGCALMALSVIAIYWMEPSLSELQPGNRWFIAKNLIWFPLGALIALLCERMGEKQKWLGIPGAALMAGAILLDQPDLLAVSLGVFLLALAVPINLPSWMHPLAKYSFGVYLVHVLFIETFQYVSPRLGLDLSAPRVVYGLIVLTAIGSFMLCIGMGRSTRLRWSVG